MQKKRHKLNPGSSKAVKQCQVCDSPELESIIFLGYFPIANELNQIGNQPHEQLSYPTQLLYCNKCHLVQLGFIVDPKIVFPPEFPYTSSTTKALRDNFAELYNDCKAIVSLDYNDLVVDIGSNDGNLLSNFKDKHRVLGVTPEEIGKLAIERGIPTIIDYFNKDIASKIVSEYGQAKLVTATNVFAHIENIHDIVEDILLVLGNEGVFISESHYLLSFINKLQYDTIYHEHQRFYSLHSLKYLLEMHGLDIIHVKQIPTHGGSIRVYSARKGVYPVNKSVSKLLEEEKEIVTSREELIKFKNKIVLSKLELHSLLFNIKRYGKNIYGIGAPARASTLLHYVGLTDGIIDCVLEVKGSHKIGSYMSGTLIPILGEAKLLEDQPDYAFLFSWHIADELIPKLRQKGFKGSFIIPLPQPKIVS